MRTLLLALASLGLAAATEAKTVYVGNDGLDGVSCGTKPAACRSLTQAIAQAADGDRIVVGPGRYGDLDGDGVLAEPGEEGGGVYGYVEVDKRVRILSRDGAAATWIDGSATSFIAVVVLRAEGATFGARGHGFSIDVNSLSDGIEVRAAGAAAAGNVVVGGTYGVSTSAGGTFADVLAVGSFIGFFAEPTGPARIERSAALGSGSSGFALEGGHELTTSIAVGSLDTGVLASDGTSIIGSAAIGNVRFGITTGTNDAPFDRVSVFGNAVETTDPNCGIYDYSGTQVVRRAYFGSPDGPGADPADLFCTEGSNAVESVSSQEVRVRLRPLR